MELYGIFIFQYIYQCVCLHMLGREHIPPSYVWRSENSFVSLVLFFYLYFVFRDQTNVTRLTGLPADPSCLLDCMCILLLALKDLSYQVFLFVDWCLRVLLTHIFKSPDLTLYLNAKDS